MAYSLVIEPGLGETRAALLRDHRAVEIHLLRPVADPAPGALYQARIARLMPDSACALLDLGNGLEAVLPYRAAPKSALVEGGKLRVEIRRAALAEGGDAKRAVASAKLRPGDPELAPGPVEPGLVRAAPHGLQRLFRDLAVDGLQGIEVEGHAGLAQVLDAIPDSAIAARLRLAEPGRFEAYGIEDELEAIAAGRIPLAGGNLRIEATDALTAIDVNAAIAGRTKAEVARAVNHAAALEIARQLRLQDIGGLIVIDFLDVGGMAERRRLETAFDQACAGDPRAIKRGKLSEFSTLTLSRERRGPSLAQRLTARPPLGLNLETRAYRLLRQGVAAAEHGGPGRLVLTLPPALREFFANTPDLLDDLKARCGRPVIIRDTTAGKEDAHVEQG